MNSLRAFVLIASACATLGCGGSAPHTEGPITTPWTEADDAALGMTSEISTPEISTPENSTSGGDASAD